MGPTRRPAFATIEHRQAAGEGCIDVEHALSWTVSRSCSGFPIAPPDASAPVILAALRARRTLCLWKRCGLHWWSADVARSCWVPTFRAEAIIDAVERKGRPVATLLWSHTGDTADIRTVNALAAHASVSIADLGGMRSAERSKYRGSTASARRSTTSRLPVSRSRRIDLHGSYCPRSSATSLTRTHRRTLRM